MDACLLLTTRARNASIFRWSAYSSSCPEVDGNESFGLMSLIFTSSEFREVYVRIMRSNPDVDKNRYRANTGYDVQRRAAALFRLENSRGPETVREVLAAPWPVGVAQSPRLRPTDRSRRLPGGSSRGAPRAASSEGRARGRRSKRAIPKSPITRGS